MATGTIKNQALAQQLLDAFDAAFGLHPGFRPAHAKGLMCSGTFTPSHEAATLTRAPHASRTSTPVTVRFSNATGLPDIVDNDPALSSPRGFAVRFHLAEHAHTDIVAQSTSSFAPRQSLQRAAPRRLALFLRRIRAPSDLWRPPSRFQPALRVRHFSRSPRLSSPTWPE